MSEPYESETDEPARDAPVTPARGGTALVMGDDTRGFLATVRSLGRQGIAVHAAPFDFRSPALRSRYITAVHDVPPWMGAGEEWLAAMHALLATHRFDLVIPCDERNLLPMHRFRHAFAGQTTFAIPNPEAVDVLFDKHETRELAHRVGVAVAPGRLARPDDDPADILAEFGAPIVIKPRRSYTIEGLAKRGRVHVTADPTLIGHLLAEAEPDSLILESCFEGGGLGLSILAHEGRLLQAFEHHRVHERSGSSFYRVSAAPSPELVEATAAICAGVRYTGVAMFEYKRNAAGGWILLEVNARPWGSLPLPVALGVDFPYRWYRLLVERVETPPVPYRVGVYGRNVLPDMMAALAEAESGRGGRLGKVVAMGSRAVGMHRKLLGNEKHDVWVGDDPRPGRAEFGTLWRGAVARGLRTLPARPTYATERARAIVRRVVAAPGPIRVLFACQGNICRSPYAGVLLQALLGEGGRVTVGSAGMMPQRGRETPALFQAQAAGEGLDLSAHRSAWLDRSTASAISLLVVFDRVNVAAVADRYPDLPAPVLMLGDLIGVGEIDDPVDGDATVVAASYATIRRAVAALSELLKST